MPSLDFERTCRDFRGANDKRVHDPRLIVDAVDVGLWGRIEADQYHKPPRRRFSGNDRLWTGLIGNELGHGDTIILENFQLLEWLPVSPGRYFTPEAVRARQEAEHYWSWTNGEYLPLGKAEMVLGGVGSVRLAPRFIRGGEVCFFAATSNGISHQGIPVVVPIEESREILRDIKMNGAWAGSLAGTLWPLPTEQSPIKFDRGLPKYFLFAEQLQRDEMVKSDPLVTVAIAYDSEYEERFERVGSIEINRSKNWSFASFNPSRGAVALKEAVDWLKRYATRHTHRYENGKELPISIVGDFDEAHQHFENPIEFPLASILSGNYDPRILDFYGRVLNVTINNEMVMGDKFTNIQNSTIITRSVIQGSIQSSPASAGADVAVARKQPAAFRKHLILFLAANAHTTHQLRLAEECAEIQRELKMSPHRDDFRFESCWAVSIDDMMRHLTELAPTVIHFSGHGGGEHGILLQDERGLPQPVSGRALAMMVDAAARNARVIVLNACYSTTQAEALRARVECVVGMDGAIGDEAARAFAVRFYGALGNRRSIGNAVEQGVAVLAAKQLPDEVLPQCVTRDGVDKYQVVLGPS